VLILEAIIGVEEDFSSTIGIEVLHFSFSQFMMKEGYLQIILFGLLILRS